MPHGFERLERLFTGSGRKERRRQKSAQQQTISIPTNRRPSSPIFPSPSYLRPTSMQMMPRDAHTGPPEEDISRSMSVPTLQEALNKRSSVASSITAVNRPSQSDASTSSTRCRTKSSPTKSRSSRFRFPEDSLFRNSRPTRSSGGFSTRNTSREQSPHTCNAEKGLLDWTPTRVSLLFNPDEFKAPSNDHQCEDAGNNTESTLLPSPDFAPSLLLPESRNSIDYSPRPTAPRCSLPPLSSPRKYSLNLRQPSWSSRRKPLIDPVTTSGVDVIQKPTINRSLSLNGLPLPRHNAARTTPVDLSPSGDINDLRNRRHVRETWGNRLEDPQCRGSPGGKCEGIPRSKLRRSASTSTLSIITPQTSRPGVLKEPTLNDFYALNDDDIAESQPMTPDARVPPAPPLKDTPNSYRKSRLPQAVAPRNITFKPVQEEITPPSTPTNCQLLTLTYSPASPRDALGALRAAELARKYDFAVLYVLSLWPVGGDHRLDAAPTAIASEPTPTNVATKERFAAPSRTTKISGRLLAAYGLNEVPSPFEIVTDTHLAALNCDYWNEYRNVDARPDDISRGWIRPFYSDYVPVSAPSGAIGGLSHGHPKNRGIVFAAYSKQTFNPVIPMRSSAKQAFLLRQLYSDAQALVEALIEFPSESMKAPIFRPGSKHSISKIHL
ncbi:hypothetical protein GQX73_g4616 [Xylaria multiplex]|uniref:Uncharacterized protein n=1 Tax=Xylaria multiplex TaxID=323545 RepID=A0A7C8IVG0_9PEZI|nr:hypothetical protein GQX73_g4616 [Xylaria multiplex]